jgi:hypothetical protein
LNQSQDVAWWYPPVSAIAFRPLGDLINEADERLANVEGGTLEKLAGQVYEVRSRKTIGDFPITDKVQGFWDRSDTEINRDGAEVAPPHWGAVN